MPTMHVPGIGTVEQKYVIAGGALVAGVVGYAWWKNRSAAADSSATDTSTGTDTSATDVGASDASTAYDPSSYDTGSMYDYSGSVPVYQSPTGYFPPPFSSSTQAPTSDAEWNAAAESVLQDRGVDAAAASAALGRYQANLCLSETQADYVRQAVAAVGDTPQTQHHISICPSGSGGGGGSSSPAGKSLPGPKGLHVTSTTKTTVGLAWSPVSGAAGYRIYRNGVGTNIGTSTGASFRVSGLHSHTTYKFHVRAVGHDGHYSDHASSSVTARTKK